ncbi:MAG: peptidyl-prolyl cis-trans isomerase [Bacteroidia bacterium]|nr:peptidyl-prolyl cis-trans isomerase [Bacteroidia bacterium]
MKHLFFLLMLPFSFFAQSKDSLVKHTDEEALQLIESYRQRVMNGESMETMAILYSEDPGSAAKGGIYKNLGKGKFVPEFEKVAFGLNNPGEISEVFKTEFGYHFIQLVARKGETVDVRHILIKTK